MVVFNLCFEINHWQCGKSPANYPLMRTLEVNFEKRTSRHSFYSFYGKKSSGQMVYRPSYWKPKLLNWNLISWFFSTDHRIGKSLAFGTEIFRFWTLDSKLFVNKPLLIIIINYFRQSAPCVKFGNGAPWHASCVNRLESSRRTAGWARRTWSACYALIPSQTPCPRLVGTPTAAVVSSDPCTIRRNVRCV